MIYTAHTFPELANFYTVGFPTGTHTGNKHKFLWIFLFKSLVSTNSTISAFLKKSFRISQQETIEYKSIYVVSFHCSIILQINFE